MMMTEEEFVSTRIVNTPRRSWGSVIFSLLLLLLSGGLFYAAYWGWQLHVSL